MDTEDRGEWLHHEHTLFLLGEARKEQSRRFFELMGACKESQDPIVVAKYSAYAACGATVALLQKGELRPVDAVRREGK